jgi:hypothetical protein
MTRRGNSKHRIGGQFVMRRIDMLRSPAFCVLSLTGRRILDRLEIEHAAHGGRDNGKLPVTFADLKKFGITNRDDIARGIRELCALGFAELTRPGRAGNGEHRAPNLFRITSQPAKGPPTNEWQRIATIEEARQIQQIARDGKKHFPVMENVTGTGHGILPITGHGNRTETPISPVTETGPLSRHLAIYAGQRGGKSAPARNPTRNVNRTNKRRRHHENDRS